MNTLLLKNASAVAKVCIFILLVSILLISCNKDTEKDDDIYGQVTDIDGNVYKTVTINGLTWMVENLRVTHYRNGDEINNIINGQDWPYAADGAYCYYNNDQSLALKYGCLYNWESVSDARGLAPEGWHVADFLEWESLQAAAGGRDAGGGVLKSEGSSVWESPNTGATNALHFSALPGGIRDGAYLGPFYHIGKGGYWWTSTSYDNLNASCWYILNSEATLFEVLTGKNCGLSVRCVKD